MKTPFNLADCHIRLATPSDIPALENIAKGIWGGSDYLPKVLPRWLAEPYFFVCEYKGTVIACIKLSLFPAHVLWFEGLRVHNRYQGKGVGSLMNREMFRFAAGLKKQDPLLRFEFCTYYKNVESLHLTQKIGFAPVKGLYALDKNGIKKQSDPKLVKDYDLSLFDTYPDYIPLGWQSVHNTSEALPFIKERCTVFETPNSRYLLAGVADKSIVFLSPPVKNLHEELPYFQHFFKPRKRYGIIIPTTFRKHLKHLKMHGFRFWDKETKPVENMLILAMREVIK